MTTLMRLCDAVVIHCRESLYILPPHCRHKAHYLPLGNYIGNYPPPRVDLRRQLSIPPEQMVLLSLGSLKRYKNIEILIEAFQAAARPDIHLIVAGLPESDAYARDIGRLVGAKTHIHLDLRHIPDNDISAFMEAADVFVSPLDLYSSLNSSAIILAFSFAKTVIAPQIGTLSDYDGQSSFFYSYTYCTPDEHVVMLQATIQKAYDDFKARPEQLRQWGQMAYEHVRTENDWEVFRPALAQVCRGHWPHGR